MLCQTSQWQKTLPPPFFPCCLPVSYVNNNPQCLYSSPCCNLLVPTFSLLINSSLSRTYPSLPFLITARPVEAKHLSVYFIFIILPIHYLVLYPNFTQCLYSFIINISFTLIIIFSCNLFIYHFYTYFYILSFILTNLILLILFITILHYIHICILTAPPNECYLDLWHYVHVLIIIISDTARNIISGQLKTHQL